MRTITLSQNKVALVDDEDYEFLNQWKWYAHLQDGNYYALRNLPTDPITKKRETARMHRIILDAPADKEVDHWDHNTLNNQRYNLRLATGKQNQHNKTKQSNNTSGYTGVSWNKQSNKWKAYIFFNKKQIHIGVFDNVVQAARAYDQKAIEIFGEFANLNFKGIKEES